MLHGAGRYRRCHCERTTDRSAWRRCAVTSCPAMHATRSPQNSTTTANSKWMTYGLAAKRAVRTTHPGPLIGGDPQRTNQARLPGGTRQVCRRGRRRAAGKRTNGTPRISGALGASQTGGSRRASAAHTASSSSSSSATGSPTGGTVPGARPASASINASSAATAARSTRSPSGSRPNREPPRRRLPMIALPRQIEVCAGSRRTAGAGVRSVGLIIESAQGAVPKFGDLRFPVIGIVTLQGNCTASPSTTPRRTARRGSYEERQRLPKGGSRPLRGTVRGRSARR